MKSVTTILLLLGSFSIFSQKTWIATNETQFKTNQNLEREVVPEAYATFSLDAKQMRHLLASAPMEDLKDTRKRGVMVSLPQPDGSFIDYSFVESPCMSPVLSAKYPHIKSYRGTSIMDGSVTRIDISNYGFRGVIDGPNGTIYIDPYFKENDGNYIVYFVVDHKVDTQDMVRSCGVTAYEESQSMQNKIKSRIKLKPSKSRGVPVTKSTYRFALSCTGAWGSQQGGTVDIVLAKLNSGTNRLNQLLEDELAMKLELVDNNDGLIFFNNNEPFSIPDSGSSCLGENTEIINRAIGADNYDFGHCFTTRCTDVGGVAFGGSACSTNNAAAGVSCVGNSPLSNFMVTTTAHEVGHQFSAGHTWAACSTDTNGQFASSSSCEPGSGVTILSYLNACGSNNLTGGDINLYHACTLDQMSSFVVGGPGGTCATQVESDNHHPDVWIEQQGGMTIPRITPFELTGEATDMDGDEMQYSWEQVDTRGTPINLQGQTGPLFRYYAPGDDKTRIFPRLSSVLNGTDWREERMPTISREFNFRFVARDDNPSAGGVSWADITFNSTDEAGPFVVLEPSSFIATEPGRTIDVTWDVANTDMEPVNCQFVDIYFSEDGGQSFPHLLKGRTPNDGSETVNIPNVRTGTGLIKVKGNNTIFFNIGRGTVRVEEPTAPTFFVDADTKTFDICLPESIETNISTASLLGFDDNVNLEVVSGLPANATYEFGENSVTAGESTNLKIDFSDVIDAGVFNIIVEATSPGVDTAELHISVLAKSTYLDDFQLMSPASGSTGIGTFPDLIWNGSGNADGYRVELATNPSFSPSSMVFIKEAGVSTSASGQINLQNSTVYYWRVIAYNQCLGEVSSDIYTFGSLALSCKEEEAIDVPVNIPSGGTPTIDSKIFIESPGKVTDINVGIIKGTHSELQSIRTSLISPSGTSCILFQGVCLNVETINAGFDDESAFANGCPNSNGKKIRPKEPLSVFIGEPIDGDWILRIEDTESGNGGLLSEFELQICSDSALDNPYIVNNNVVEIRTGSGDFISKDDLLCADDNNTPDELLYTLVEIPSKGTLSKGSETLAVGAQFTQDELSSGRIKYVHNGTNDEQDQFVFTLIDGEGGWIDKTIFLINLSADGFSETSDLESANRLFDIYPNPTNDLLNVDPIQSDNKEWNYVLSSSDGKSVLSSSFTGKTIINIKDQATGIYILNLTNGSENLYKKILIVE